MSEFYLSVRVVMTGSEAGEVNQPGGMRGVERSWSVRHRMFPMKALLGERGFLQFAL